MKSVKRVDRKFVYGMPKLTSDYLVIIKYVILEGDNEMMTGHEQD